MQKVVAPHRTSSVMNVMNNNLICFTFILDSNFSVCPQYTLLLFQLTQYIISISSKTAVVQNADCYGVVSLARASFENIYRKI